MSVKELSVYKQGFFYGHLLKSLTVRGSESTVVGGVSYDIEWKLIGFLLEQEHSVILDSPCLYEGMLEKE